jgi:quinoprotein glucose dehydrogenase
MSMLVKRFVVVAVWISLPSAGFAAELPQASRFRPAIAAASDEGRQAISRFRLPSGATVRLLAAEPMLANPVAFGLDERGRAYVAETFRFHKGVTDLRSHMDWLEDDLASRTVADRVAMYRKHLKDEFPTFSVEQERIKLLEDTDGDGIYDKDTVYADGFRNPEDGLGAGVLARKDAVYYTCLPKLWLLGDSDGDGTSDNRTALHDGFGVHVAFLGHDLHGLRIGPDGRLYFTIGDRGINVLTKEGRRLMLPDTGSVLRCELDGTNLEVFASGLRNPQEVVFDDRGNLFTHDNNSDSGSDKCRVTYLIEGGDHGWRIGYQFFEDRGAWNSEKLWYPPFADQAASIVPPIANLGNGPAGLTYNPGLGLGGRFQQTFFVADFKGSNALSGVRTFTLEPNGAGFQMNSADEFLWGMCATDVDFAPDGSLVMSDWVDGWAQPGKGRLYAITFPDMAGREDLEETRRIIAEDLTKRSVADLTGLLDHADMRVRQEAQFALVSKGADGATALEAAAIEAAVTSLPGRLHAIWGLGMLARRNASQTAVFRRLLDDRDAEVRAQAAKVLADTPDMTPATFERLAALLEDDSHRVRFFAAMALGKTGESKAAPLIRDAVAAAGDRDPWLRHAYVMALSRINDQATIKAMAVDSRPSVRKAAAVVLRRLDDAAIATLLRDDDRTIALEAARAIHDEPIQAALPDLAMLDLDMACRDIALVRRVIAANVRLGGRAQAGRLVEIGSSSTVPPALRAEAIVGLARWGQGRSRDPIVGVWRPISPHPLPEAIDAFLPCAEKLVADEEVEVSLAAIRTARVLKSESARDALKRIVAAPPGESRLRVEALLAIEAMNDAALSALVEVTLTDRDERMRAEARRILAQRDPARLVALAEDVLERGSLREKQSMIDTVGRLDAKDATSLVVQWTDRLLDGRMPADLQLDLLLAARALAERDPGSGLSQRIQAYESTKPEGDAVARFRECLEGGDAKEGRRIVMNSTAAACLRCHVVTDRGLTTGGNVGPALNGIGSRHDRRALLESIVAPNARIAEGFTSVVLALADGTVVAGVLKSENDKEVIVITADAVQVAVAVADIEDRAAGVSAMPGDLSTKLTPREIRDVVEFLSTLRSSPGR